jgi:hypothetical protein
MQYQQSNSQNEERNNYVNLDQLPQPELKGHAWRQRGTELICESCPFTHSSYIPPEYQLYGIDKDGMPMIRKLNY